MHPNQMTEDQLQEVTKLINQISLYLISHTTFDPEVIEVMKQSALVNVHRRFENGEPW